MKYLYNAGNLAACTSMRGVEVTNVRRTDFVPEKRLVHIRRAKRDRRGLNDHEAIEVLIGF